MRNIVFNLGLYEIQTLIAALGTLLFGLVSLLRNPKNKLNITLALFNFMVMFWMIDLFLIRTANSVNAANTISRFLRPTLLFIPVFFIRFVILFVKLENRWIKLIYNFLLYFMVIISILNIMGIGFKGFSYKPEYGYVAKPDFIYFCLIINFLTALTIGIYTLIKKYLSSNILSIEKKQTQYLLLAFVILTIFGVMNVLNIFGIKIYPMGGFGGLLYTFIITYAVLNYDLLRIKELLVKALVYCIIGLVLLSIYAILLPVLEKIPDIKRQLAVSLFAGITAIFLITKLYEILNKFAGEIFLNKKDLERSAVTIREQTATKTNLDEILNEINSAAIKVLELKSSYFLVQYGKDNNFANAEKRANLTQEHPLIKLLISKKQKIYFEELNNRLYYLIGEKGIKSDIEQMIAVMKQFEAAACFPVFIGSNLKGAWFLGERKSKNVYSREEIRFINSVIYNLSVRMENILLYEQLASSERLVMLGKMAAAVAHEIRNPLTGLGGFVEMMASKKNGDAVLMGKFLEIAPAEFKRLEKLTDNLLALSHTTKIKLENVDIAAVIDDVNLFMSHVHKMYGIQVVKNFNQLPLIHADKEQTMQVILNVMINAIQSMPEGGTVEVTANNEMRDGKEYLIISVKDTGCGIDENIKDKIFEPFFTTKADGTGLGLAVSKKIMELHNGFIEVKTRKGEGSTFYLWFPLKQ